MADTGYHLSPQTERTIRRIVQRAMHRCSFGQGTPDDLRLAAAVLDAGGFTEDAERVRAMEGR